MATDTSTNSTPQDNLQTGGAATDPFLSAIQDKLLSQSGIVSSTGSELESRIQSAMSGVKSATQSESQRIESQFGRDIGYAQDTAAANLDSGRSAGSGGVMNMAALRELTNTTDKQLKDLEQRKQELILQNNSQGATQIANLEMQALQFQQQAQQQVFSNLLGMANYSVTAQQESRLAKQQSFTEQQALSTVALKYGITLKDGDTMESVVTRAMPTASKQQQAELAKTLAETRRIEADIQKIARDGVDSTSDFDLDTIANAYLRVGDSVASNLTDMEFSKVVNRAAAISTDRVKVSVQDDINAGKSKSKILTSIRENPDMSAEQKNEAISYLEKNYKEPVKEKSTRVSSYKPQTNRSTPSTINIGMGEPMSFSEMMNFAKGK